MKISRAKTFPYRTIIGLAIATIAGATNAQEIDPECRGVAAGVVAAMKSSGEITGSEAASAAIVAARRACAAALEGGFSGTTTNPASTNESTNTASRKDDSDGKSMWDFLTRDRSDKGGHDRLRRLKTQ